MSLAFQKQISLTTLWSAAEHLSKLLTFSPACQTMVAVGELRSNYKRMAHNGKFIC